MLGTIPFALVMLAMVAALIAFPQIALFLPQAL
jgi:C4-dicarboxylate transporter, DctM subunit